MDPARVPALRVAFAGTPAFAAVALTRLLESPHSVVGVLTQPDRPAGRGRRLEASAVKRVAVARGLPVQQPESLRPAAAQDAIHALAADVLVVAAYGLILPPAVLALPPLGCLNIHASLLPRWRGAAPIQRAILAGDERTGISIMQMDAGLDTGDVWRVRDTPIVAGETAGELHDRLAALGAATLLDVLADRARGEGTATPQDDTASTYAERLSKHEARLDFQRPAIELQRRILAFDPWPVAEAMLGDERLRIRGARIPDDTVPSDAVRPGTVTGTAGQAVRVQTIDGVIDLLELQRPGRRSAPAADVARGLDLVGRALH